MLLFNANFGDCKLIIDSKIHTKKSYTLFFIVKIFFLKTSSISAVMIVVNLFSLAVFTVVLFNEYFQRTCLWRIGALKEEKKYEQVVLSFCLVSFVLNVYVFVYNGSKQSRSLQTKPIHFLQIFFIGFLFIVK